MTTINRDIKWLLENGIQVWPHVDNQTMADLQESIVANGKELDVPVMLSARGKLIDGHMRLEALYNLGRKRLKDTEFKINRQAKDDLSEYAAAGRYQLLRRQHTPEQAAAMAAGLMRRFNLSQNAVAEALGVSGAAVSKWFKANPQQKPQVDFVVGKDGKAYDTESTPKSSRRAEKTPGREIKESIAKHHQADCTPDFQQWVVTEHDPADRATLIGACVALSQRWSNLKEALEGEQFMEPAPAKPSKKAAPKP